MAQVYEELKENDQAVKHLQLSYEIDVNRKIKDKIAQLMAKPIVEMV
jgi:hypothetical protein